ncbi:geranylgeranyl reductase family protein [Saccharopolyspora erythraea NRRL 2338]|uniref:Electron transfer oxidoreductase n=2 Tax=Saccharopolyspora erythraea TaxID=1836 RepID=A4FPU2_SACEN|nr:geranylgeranyl reductase family protein [Saccharopolyspora erythraea]EQD86949.1 drug:proton antiporter [Saccharopolyspora erythraea D]PFG99712.1 geranylgeranyl reductase family protein [Saccharopolyspora erythraea NRRL 2338]QRK89595.1 geranylgeranyl reductase family protein [Saccharopolyspora erythraea]CAM06067.1 electron transfer oxidoreductase [Saccharopolyspora erythraea NRRL 2338]
MTSATSRRGPNEDADVIVVGAGPAGSTAATYLARAGLDVLLLEKSTFPREKVCGDGITPRGVKQLVDLGVDTREEAGWLHNRGLRVVGGGVTVELDWPSLADFPPYGVVRPRNDFDDLLAGCAKQAGARMVENTTVTGAVTDDRTGRVVGVEGKSGPEREPVTYRAPLVLGCDGVSARLALSVGIQKREDRPMGVAVRRYYDSPRTKDDFLESHLELWDRSNPAEPTLLPGYGWIFGMGDGTVNVGLGILSTSKAYGNTDYRQLLRSWLDGTPEEWGFREENATGRIGGAALPMGFNRVPHYRDGLLLVGDAGGMVNPFNGEGIAYAMESARLAAECVVHAMARPAGHSREQALGRYPRVVSQSMGGYFRMGHIFTKLIGNPTVMRMATKHGLPRTTLMRFVLKLLANLYDAKDGDAMDRVISATTRLTPSA